MTNYFFLYLPILSKHEKATSKLKLGGIHKCRFFVVEYEYNFYLCQAC